MYTVYVLAVTLIIASRGCVDERFGFGRVRSGCRWYRDSCFENFVEVIEACWGPESMLIEGLRALMKMASST